MPRLARRGENRDTLTRLARLKIFKGDTQGGVMVADPNWTSEEAWAEHQRAISLDPSRPDADPTLPYYQWAAMQTLKHLEGEFCKGDSWALMSAIRICAQHDLSMPDWASRAYISAYDRVLNAREKSWDAVFGSPYPKGTNLNSLRKKQKMRPAVWSRIVETIKCNPEIPIDSCLFENIGKEFNIGKTLAEEYYREMCQRTGFGATDVKKRMR